MKKLQLKIKDLKNPSILTNSEIKKVMGGSDDGSGSGSGSGSEICMYVTYDLYNVQKMDYWYFSGSCEEKSAQANQACVDILNNYMYIRCTYDCVCDGIGK